MRFPYVALTIKPNANEITCNVNNSTYIKYTLFKKKSELDTLWAILK